MPTEEEKGACRCRRRAGAATHQLCRCADGEPPPECTATATVVACHLAVSVPPPPFPTGYRGKINLRAPKPPKPVRRFHRPPSLLRQLLLKRSMEEEQQISVGTPPLRSPKRRNTSLSVGSNELDLAGCKGPPSSPYGFFLSELCSSGSNSSIPSVNAVERKRCQLKRNLTKCLVKLIKKGLITDTEMMKTASSKRLERESSIDMFLAGDTKFHVTMVKAICKEVKQGAII